MMIELAIDHTVMDASDFKKYVSSELKSKSFLPFPELISILHKYRENSLKMQSHQ